MQRRNACKKKNLGTKCLVSQFAKICRRLLLKTNNCNQSSLSIIKKKKYTLIIVESLVYSKKKSTPFVMNINIQRFKKFPFFLIFPDFISR